MQSFTENIRLDVKPTMKRKQKPQFPERGALSDYLKPSRVLIGLEGETKQAIIENLVRFLSKDITQPGREQIVHELMKREALKTTAVQGFALPHCYNEQFKKTTVALGISQTGLDFDSLDGEKTFLFFLIVSQPPPNFEYLYLVSKIVHLIQIQDFVAGLKAEPTAEAAIRFIVEHERNISNMTSGDSR